MLIAEKKSHLSLTVSLLLLNCSTSFPHEAAAEYECIPAQHRSSIHWTKLSREFVASNIVLASCKQRIKLSRVTTYVYYVYSYVLVTGCSALN